MQPLSSIAESYVKLALSVGRYDEHFVDAYLGPERWLAEAQAAEIPLPELMQKASDLLQSLRDTPTETEEERKRQRNLEKLLHAVWYRIRFLLGERSSFDDEAQALYDTQPPHTPESYFQSVLRELEMLFPGSSPLPQRIEQYRQHFIVPPETLEQLFTTALQECRSRTLHHIDLPHYEQFTLEFVHSKPWSGYNWFKGNAQSLIQINVDLPITIDRIIDLAAHEGYPGHHVYNTILEEEFLKKRRWHEFSIAILFSPLSLIAEGTANYGIEVAFPGTERMEYEREVLYPLCNFDRTEAERFARLQQLTQQLGTAHIEAARSYLDGQWTHEQTREWLITYALLSPERALQRIQFFETYRSYVINYSVGLELVRRYCEQRMGDEKNSSTRWKVFRTLLQNPVVPSEFTT